MDEQLVMERTGHRSLECVRSYKRTSDLQREALSDILNQQSYSLDMVIRRVLCPIGAVEYQQFDVGLIAGFK